MSDMEPKPFMFNDLERDVDPKPEDKFVIYICEYPFPKEGSVLKYYRGFKEYSDLSSVEFPDEIVVKNRIYIVDVEKDSIEHLKIDIKNTH